MKHKKVRWILPLCAVLLLVPAIMGGRQLLSAKTTYTFSESREVLNNPFQGMYMQKETDHPEKLEDLPKEGVGLVLLAYNLNHFQEEPLSGEKLKELRTALLTARKLRLQVIFRPAYGFVEGMQVREPESFERVCTHIRQIAPILNDYRDVILCVQAGMLGPWGESHSSVFFTDDAAETQARDAVSLLWHQLLHESLQLQLRTPRYIQSAAAAGVPLWRMGLHNDALLSSETDLNSYRDRKNDLNWINKNLPHSRTGGEAAALSPYADAQNAVQEFHALRLTYLNLGYNEEVLELWRRQEYLGENAFTYIRRHLGLRLHVSRALLPRRISRMASKGSLVLQSTGFSDYIEPIRYKIAVKQDGRISYLAPQEVKIRQEEVSIRFNLEKQLSGDGAEIGLWAGYGEPNDGYDFTLANEAVYRENSIMFFGRYQKNGPYYSLVEP